MFHVKPKETKAAIDHALATTEAATKDDALKQARSLVIEYESLQNAYDRLWREIQELSNDPDIKRPGDYAAHALRELTGWMIERPMSEP